MALQFLFSLLGSWTSQPTPQGQSGISSDGTPINEQMNLISEQRSLLTLSADGVISVPFGNITGAHVVTCKPVGGWVNLILTSANGISQTVPVGQLATIISDPTLPFTAVSVSRQPGTTVQVQLFLGQNN